MPANPHFRRVRIILGDQLNPCHSWFNETNPETLYIIAELISETQYTRHHLQKISAFFTAMADFASNLKEQGHAVCHLTLDDTQQYKNFTELLTALAEEFQASHIDYQRPDEYRLLQEFRTLNIAATSIEEFDTEHFLLPFDQLGKHFKQGKSARLEAFYRRLRKQFSILMEGDNPSGGQWNYDSSNRKKFKARDLELLPEPKVFSNDTTEVMQRIHRHNVACIGRGQQQLNLPANRQQSLEMLEFFCVNCLPNFGDFQDAMTESSPHAWSLYHSRLSFSLNTKMLNPKEVIGRAIDEYERRQDIDVSQIEGFVRQILGWREYIRGIYWCNMPDYATGNYFQANRDLPGFFWNAETRMNCIAKAVTQSLETAYAHHIQRLMVTGEFTLLAGIDPSQVDDWYLGIYADAIEWVQLPNTRGMSQYADGGLIASKPYAASGNYINKMSDYCRNCTYNVKSRSDEDSCPFNSLYWDFLERHRSQIGNNTRLKMAYVTWDRFDQDTQAAILARASYCLNNLETL